MVAGGAYFWGFGAGVFISAHEAFPYDGFLAFPHCSGLYLMEVVEEAAAVVLFDRGDCAEVLGDFCKAFFIPASPAAPGSVWVAFGLPYSSPACLA